METNSFKHFKSLVFKLHSV